MAATVGKEREEAVVHPNPRQGGKLLSRLLTRDSSAAAPSFRVYYGVSSAGAVPFLWESQPGTPKNAVFDAAMPPLTPPPSYYAAAAAGAAKKHAARKAATGGKRFRPSVILGSILMATRRRGRTTPSGSPTSSFSSVSTSSSSSSSSASSFRRTTQSPMRGSSSRLHSSSSFSDDEETAMATCFRVRHESFRALKGCRVAVTVRSALASVGGAAVQRV